jgi:hypothetical protein
MLRIFGTERKVGRHNGVQFCKLEYLTSWFMAFNNKKGVQACKSIQRNLHDK